MNPVLDSADVVVIGAGIAGITTAYELQKRGYDVVVVEQRFPAYGASGRSSGAIWLQTCRAGVELELSRAGVEMYRRYCEELGNTFDFRQYGGLFFFETDEQRTVLEEYVQDRSAQGLDMSMLDAMEAKQRFPLLPSTAIGAVYCADDAQVDAARFINTVAGASVRNGVRIYENTSVIQTIRKGDAVVGVRTTRGDIASPGVAWATGAWAVNLSAEGVDLPITTARQGLVLSQKVPPVQAPAMRGPRGIWGACAVKDLASYRPEYFSELEADAEGQRAVEIDDTIIQNSEGGIYFGSSIDVPGALNPHIGIAPTAEILSSVLNRYPERSSLGIVGLWAGITSWTSDDLPIIDRVDGVYLNAAHSRGIATGGIGGEVMASVIAGESHEYADALRLDRLM